MIVNRFAAAWRQLKPRPQAVAVALYPDQFHQEPMVVTWRTIDKKFWLVTIASTRPSLLKSLKATPR